MAASESLQDREWKDLADLEERDREPEMKRRYEALANVSEEERTSRLASMEKAIYALPDDKIRSFTISRLRTWLSMEPDTAQKISHSFDTMTDQLPGPIAMRHVGVVQTMAREFSSEDQARLNALFPRIFGVRGSVADIAAPAEAVSTPTKKPWWAFWKR